MPAPCQWDPSNVHTQTTCFVFFNFYTSLCWYFDFHHFHRQEEHLWLAIITNANGWDLRTVSPGRNATLFISEKKNSFPSFPKSSSSTHPCYHWHHPHWEAVLDDYLLNHFTLEVGICRPAAAEYLREEKCLQLNFCLLCVYLTNALCCCQWGRVGKYSVAKSWNWNTSNAILS